MPTIVSEYESCPTICRLVEMPGETPYNTEIVQDFTSGDGGILIALRTSNKSYHGSFIDFSL